MDILKEKI